MNLVFKLYFVWAFMVEKTKEVYILFSLQYFLCFQVLSWITIFGYFDWKKKIKLDIAVFSLEIIC